MSDSGTHNNFRPIAAAIGFAASIGTVASATPDTQNADFVLTIGVAATFIFGLLLVREVTGSLLPADIRSYLTSESTEDK